MMDFKAFQGEEHRAFFLEGGKPAALLVHGFPGTPAEMRPLGEVLHRAGWTVQAVLLPGFGADIETLSKRQYSDWLAAATSALGELQRQHSPLLLVGNSMGGALSIQAASQRPVDGLVLFAPFWNLNHVLWQLLPALKYIFPTIRPFGLMKMDFSNPEVRDGIHNFMPGADLDNPQVQQAIRELQIPVGVFDQIRTAGQKAYQSAPNLDVPTLVFQGSEDDLVRPEMTQQLVQRMKGQVIYTQVQGKHNLLDPHSSVWPKIENAVLEFTRKLL